jgi:hypothetical protein
MEKSPRYPLDTRMGGPQSRSGRGGEEKNPCPSRESNSGHPAHNLVTVLVHVNVTEVFQVPSHPPPHNFVCIPCIPILATCPNYRG